MMKVIGQGRRASGSWEGGGEGDSALILRICHLKAVAAFVAEQVVMQLLVPLPAGTLHHRSAELARRQTLHWIGDEAPSLWRDGWC